MREKRPLKTLLAALFVVSSLAMPVTFLTADAPIPPTLDFTGMEINVLPDDKDGENIQLLLTVALENIPYSAGTSFRLQYNDQYLVPSVRGNNAPLDAVNTGVLTAEKRYFSIDSALYGGNDPFYESIPASNIAQGRLDTKNNYLAMDLQVKQTLTDAAKVGAVDSKLSVDSQTTKRYYLDCAGKKVALGTLSFRVQKGKLPAVVAAFGGKSDVNFAPADGEDFLLKFFKATGTPTPPLWELGIYETRSSGLETRLGTIAWRNHQDALQPTKPVRSVITYTFPETITSVTPANPQVTVNAYQAFHKGDQADLALTLQKYSPMVTATYQDGARRNLMMPWGRADAPGFDYGYTVKNTAATPAVIPPESYDPTGALVPGEGMDYQISQYFYYVPNDAAGNPLVGSDGKPVYKKVATPVTAQMAVTQVKATAVTADSLDMAFPLSAASVAGLSTLDALQLPETARIVTDVVPGGPSLTLPISGWTAARSDANGSGAVSKWPNTTITPPEELDKLVADESLANPLIHWPTIADVGAVDGVLQGRVGTYRFQMAPVAGGTATPYFTKEQLTQAYPWLTADATTYTLPAATRRLAMANVLRSTADFDRITAVTDGGTGNVTLTVKISTAAVKKDFAQGTTFAVYSPTGAEITPVTATAVGMNGYTLTFPFPVGTDPSAEALRRQINLGGVFWVTMTENGTLTSRYPAYVGPRENRYSEGKDYNFIAQGAGLYNWPGTQGTGLFLPQGKFEALDPTGVPLFVDGTGASASAGAPGATPKLENYGVQTTYDGVVGSQPGVMQNFAAENWTKNVTGAVATYGPADFAAKGVYGAYGQVVNAASKKQVTLRTIEPDKTPTPNAESLTLTYEAADNIAPDNALPDKRILATFNTQREGYAQRQDYTLTLTNSGKTDIYGLFVDTTTFQDHRPISASEPAARGGGHFALLKPPATFLPAGGSTTFTLTYVYDLRSHNGNFDYRDTLYITSTSHDKAVNTGAATVPAGENILLKFDAKFTVSESAVHGVTVVTAPPDGSMGTAGLIVGQTNTTGTGADVMDLTAGSNAYPGKAAVYLQVVPLDEYTIASVTYSGSGGSGVLEKYNKQSPQADPNIPAGTEIYVLKEMPSYNIIITVTFEEPITSKLRLGALKVYGEALDENLKLDGASVATPTELPLLKKNITNENLAAAQRELEAGGYGSYTIDHVLMQMLDVKAAPATFDNTESHFIAVVPFTAEYVQLEGTLRAVLSASTGLEGVKVEMKVFNEAGKEPALQNATLEVVDPATGRTNDDPATGNTIEGPTRHLSLNTNINNNHNPVSSRGLPAPLPGKSKYVQITLSYTPSGKPTEARSYFIELHRNTEHTVAVPSAGNSPYGMIENDPLILPKDKEAAKKAFVAAGYRFAGVSQTEVPQYVKNTPLMNAVYSREAWANPGAYEPESGTGLHLYDEKNNLDLNPAALFIIPGQAFQDPGLSTVTDSSGREADKTGAYITVTVDLLDTAAAAQTARFTSKRSVTLQLGAEGALVPADWAKETITSPLPGTSPVAVRPGAYELVYHFKDVDSGPVDTAEKPWLTFQRPLVILSALGDVNAGGGAPDAADQTQIISRIGDPLGYTATPYPGANLFRYRCCDANCDRNINNIDANELKANPTPRIGFYLPTGYRAETPVTP